MSEELIDYYDEKLSKIYLQNDPRQILEGTSNLKMGDLSERKTC